ncbi:hypothetical protein [Streptomyces sp. A1136]|uniref:hypothetical protein n=1 Tax=Streptomyces sp. A1136 TaxID=2563102 RepID=UPI0014486B70|nr:hypothetical protein [Streptomyces sp. A1136]
MILVDAEYGAPGVGPGSAPAVGPRVLGELIRLPERLRRLAAGSGRRHGRLRRHQADAIDPGTQLGFRLVESPPERSAARGA